MSAPTLGLLHMLCCKALSGLKQCGIRSLMREKWPLHFVSWYGKCQVNLVLFFTLCIGCHCVLGVLCCWLRHCKVCVGQVHGELAQLPWSRGHTLLCPVQLWVCWRLSRRASWWVSYMYMTLSRAHCTCTGSYSLMPRITCPWFLSVSNHLLKKLRGASLSLLKGLEVSQSQRDRVLINEPHFHLSLWNTLCQGLINGEEGMHHTYMAKFKTRSYK